MVGLKEGCSMEICQWVVKSMVMDLCLFNKLREIVIALQGHGYTSSTIGAELQAAVDQLLKISLHSLNLLKDSNFNALETSTKAFNDFVGEVLSIPNVSLRFSNGLKNIYLDLPMWTQCLRSVCSNHLVLPPSGAETFSSEMALLGNLIEIGSFTLDNAAMTLEERSLQCSAWCILLEILGDSLPLILSDRGAVSWKVTGSTFQASAIPEQLTRQLSFLFSARLIRNLTIPLIQGIDEEILKHATADEEKEVAETLECVAAEIARESMKNQSKGWFGAAWAKKLSQGFSVTFGSKFSLGSSNKSSVAEEKKSGFSLLRNISKDSRARAEGKMQDNTIKAEISRPMMTYNTSAVLSVCKLWALLLCALKSTKNSHLLEVLNTLAFSTPLVACTWAFLQAEGYDQIIASISLAEGIPTGPFAVMAVFVQVYSHLLIVLDDSEVYESGKPFPLHQIKRIVSTFKCSLFRYIWESDSSACSPFSRFLADSTSNLLKNLHDRSSRRPLCAAKVWLVEEASRGSVLREVQLQTPRGQRLLCLMPYCLAFQERLRLFQQVVREQRQLSQPEGTPGSLVRIRRGFELEDGLRNLDKLGERLKQRIVVVYVNAAGQDEPGIDIGGLFKEFWTELSTQSFDLQFGLFKLTEDQLMYPSPLSQMIHGSLHLTLFEFLGRILGKALFEGITVQSTFAHFFLSFIRGNYNFLNLFNDLCTLDPELYKNLMFLKTYDGDVSDLCLTFTVTEDNMGAQNEVELVPAGSQLPVSSTNKHRYIHLVAKYHLYDVIQHQAEAFTRGLWEVINPKLLQMFNEPELQILISGSSTGIDIEDMKHYTRYTGGYTGFDRNIKRFWKILEEMNPREQAALLKFATSCQRPPPLGFEALNPPFTIHRVGISNDDEKLPSASTCFNTLKLPTYSSEKVMKAKLLLSIFSGAGFELS